MPPPPIHFELALPAFQRPGDLVQLPVDLHNPSAEDLAVEVVLRGPASLASEQLLLAAGGRARLFPFLMGEEREGLLESLLTVRSQGLAEQVPVRVPLVRGGSGDPAVDILRTSHGEVFRKPEDQGFRVERHPEDLDGNPLPCRGGDLDVPLGAAVSVRLRVTGTPGRAALLTEALPAGFVWEDGAEPQPLRFLPGEGQIEFGTEALPEEGWTVRYRLRATTPGAFLFPPAQARDLAEPERRGRTGWSAVTIAREPFHLEGEGLSVVQWGEDEDGAVSYRLYPLDGWGREGRVWEDGSVWEHRSEDRRWLEVEGLGWYGLMAPPVLVASPLGAVALFSEMWSERRIASPRRRKNRYAKKIAILPAEVRLREGPARRVRARLRELGCPCPHVARP